MRMSIKKPDKIRICKSFPYHWLNLRTIHRSFNHSFYINGSILINQTIGRAHFDDVSVKVCIAYQCKAGYCYAFVSDADMGSF